MAQCAWRIAGKVCRVFRSAIGKELDYIDRFSVHPEPASASKFHLPPDWMDRIGQLFRNRAGFAVFIDYGYTREEQLAGRHRDTLMTYRQHRATASPYEAPGEQDITAHVNFTALRARAAERGLDDIALLTQTQLLLGIGEADAIRRRLPGLQAAARAGQGCAAIATSALARRDGREVSGPATLARHP